MSKLLVIFGITGQQGSSLAHTILTHATLSQTYTIRGITRDLSKPVALALQAQGIEIVRGDCDDPHSIRAALAGAHTVFALTVSQYVPGGREAEFAQGKTIADESVKAGVECLIYMTVPSPAKLTDGKFPVASFDVKEDVKEYIQSLPIRALFFAPGSFMQNFHTISPPHALPSGQLAMTNFVTPTTQYPLIDIAADTGKFVTPLLATPEKFPQHHTVCAATRLYTWAEIAQIMSRASGKEVVYNQVPKEVYAGFLPEALREPVVNMHAYFEAVGYYGLESEGLVREAAEGALGEVTELEDYFRRNPLPVGE